MTTHVSDLARAWLLRVCGPAYRRAGSTDLIDGDVSTTEETADDPDTARRAVAARRGVPLANISHVLDDAGAPVYRDYEPIRGAYGTSCGARYDRDEEIPATGPGRGKSFF